MAKKGQVIINNITGEQVTFLETASDTNGKYLRFTLNVKPHGYVLVNHIHPSQDEQFDVKQGTLKLMVGKEIMYLPAGGSYNVPKGVNHQWWNESEEDISIEVTFTPALNTEVFLEQIFGLCNDGKCNAKGIPPFLQIMALSNTYEMYVQGPPIPIQKIMSTVLGPIGGLMGYKKYYKKYAAQ